MPDKATLSANAQDRLEDAKVLFDRARYHGAAYVCGYAVEFALKARICETLDVEPYPEKERLFKTHELDTLLLLSGRKKFIDDDPSRKAIWSTVTSRWSPEMRYQATSTFTRIDAETMIKAVEDVLQLV